MGNARDASRCGSVLRHAFEHALYPDELYSNG